MTDDFGFTFSDGTDIPEVAHATTATAKTSDKLTQVMNMMNNFLDNLQKEPQKKYLLWPDRVAKVKAFQEKLNKIA